MAKKNTKKGEEIKEDVIDMSFNQIDTKPEKDTTAPKPEVVKEEVVEAPVTEKKEETKAVEPPVKTVVKKQPAKPVKKLYKFYGVYNNVAIGPRVKLNGVKIVHFETLAINQNEAMEYYKLHLNKKMGIAEANISKYLADVFYNKILIEVVDADAIKQEVITII